VRLGRAWWLGAGLTVTVIGLLAAQEAAQVISDVAVAGATYPGSALERVPEAWSAGSALGAWARASCAGIPMRAMLGWLVAADLVFTAGVAAVGLGAAARWARLRIRPLVRWLAGVAVAGDLAAGVAVALLPAGRGCAPGSYPPAVLAAAIAVLATVKTLLAIALAVRVAWVAVLEDRAAGPGEPSHPAARRMLKAAGIQVFIVIVVIALAALLLLSGQPVLEQGIDAERSWVLAGGDRALGAARAGWALAAMIVLACGLRYLASVRVAPFQVRPGGRGAEAPPAAPAETAEPAGRITLGRWAAAFWRSLRSSWTWLLAAAAVAALFFGLGATPLARVYWEPALAVIAVLVAVPVASAALALAAPLGEIDVSDLAVRQRAWQTGRALAWAVPAILLVSVSRALVQPLILLPASGVTVTVFAVASVAAVAYTALFLSVGTAPKVRDETDARRRPLDPVDPQLVGARAAPDPAVPGPRVPGRVASLLPAALVTAACAVPLLIFPAHTSRFLSVTGTLGLSLLLLTAFYAVLQILAQLTDPPWLFRVLGVRRAPVVSIVAVIALLGGVAGRDSAVHDIRAPARAAVAATAPRPGLAAGLAAWRAGQQAGCAVPVPGQPGARVLPLILVAAEGGGIRAAWWTVDAMTALTSTDCGRRAVFLASGVSGGAVGLALLATTPAPAGPLDALAGPDALAAGLDGMLSRDLIAGSFGLSVRAADGPSGDPFPDRAALMEQAWQRAAPGLADPFPVPAADRAVPWYTVLNGTSVAHKCRVLISDIRLTGATACDAPGNPMPGAYDLLSAEPCDAGLATSTAALLAARFPYVSPSGVLRSCRTGAFADQVIDGGYSDNSGLETVDDTLVQLMPLVRALNSQALRSGGPLIAPLAIFVHNTVDASDTAAPQPPAAEPELVVPPENNGDSAIIGANATLLQRASGAAADWVPDAEPAATAAALRSAVARALGLQAVTIAPQQEPAIGVPLGWTLSPGTRDSLNRALGAYLSCRPDSARSCAESQALDGLLRHWGTVMRFPAP
jgi:hypothetical protein